MDADNDGTYESYLTQGTRIFIYDSVDDIPSIDTMVISVTEKAPDGSVVYTGKRYLEYDDTGIPRFFSIPEIENGIMSSIDASEGYFWYESGFDRIQTDTITSNRSITVNTVDPDSIKLGVGADEVYAYFDENVKGINVSIDGVHFYGSGYLTGLKPDTDYTLYYKQGVKGTVYTKSFKTAKTGYGVYIGTTPVTDQNLGSLEGDGWHYDPATMVLTIKDLDLTSAAVPVISKSFFGASTVYNTGVIAAKHDFTIELQGSSSVTCSSADGLYRDVICADGDLTIRGNGDITLRGVHGGFGSADIFANGNITLESTGKVIMSGTSYGIDVSDRKTQSIIYKNGEYLYYPIMAYGSNSGSMISNDANITLSGVHSLSVTYGMTLDEIDNNTVAAEDITTAMKGRLIKSGDNSWSYDYYYLHLVPVHNCNKSKISYEYLAEGSCEEGALYYKSCSCGYTNRKSTFAAGESGHNYSYINGKEPTCTEDGYKDYHFCTKCGDSDFEAIPATGHTWVHHDTQAPTCTSAGWEAYDECTSCGITTYKEIPATGHSLVHHEAQAPTCTQVGWQAYDTCENCDYTTYKVIPATGHSLVHHEGKAATETESGWKPYDECKNCDYSTYETIPALAASDPLVNNSTISAEEIAVGEKVTISGNASGGTAPYTFTYEYQKSGKTTWTQFGTGTSAVFKPGAGTFTVKVTAKDSTEATDVKLFTVTCSSLLQNNSTISADEIALGDKVTITGKASGGTAPYTYKYEYQKAGKTTWTQFGSGSAAVFKPGTGTFTVRVTVSDSAAKTAEKSFTVKVS